MKTKFYFLVISLLAICSVCLPACDNDEKGDAKKTVIGQQVGGEERVKRLQNIKALKWK